MTETTHLVSPFSTDFLRCPFEHFTRLRREAPVYQVPGMPFFLVTRYEDCLEVLSDPERFQNSREGLDESFQAIGFMPRDPDILQFFAEALPAPPALIHTDPPRHTVHRKLINRWFTPKRVEAMWAGIIERHVDRLISEFAPRGEVEFIEEFAAPMPNMVMAEILGVEGERWRDIKRWSDESVLPLGRQLTDDQWRAHASGTVEMQEFLYEALTYRLTDPGDDLISELARHLREDPEAERLTEFEVLSLLSQLLAAGNETTTQLLGNAMLLFASMPTLQERLHEHPEEVAAAVEEAVRVASPVMGLFRTVHRDTRLGDVDIPAGSVLAVMFASANHDESEFPKPDHYDMDREELQQHIAFGRGIHYCVGAPLARAEARITFTHLFTRFENIRIPEGAQPRDGEPSFMLRSLVELPLEFTVR